MAQAYSSQSSWDSVAPFKNCSAKASSIQSEANLTIIPAESAAGDVHKERTAQIFIWQDGMNTIATS